MEDLFQIECLVDLWGHLVGGRVQGASRRHTLMLHFLQGIIWLFTEGEGFLALSSALTYVTHNELAWKVAPQTAPLCPSSRTRADMYACPPAWMVLTSNKIWMVCRIPLEMPPTLGPAPVSLVSRTACRVL